jgi:hypothetical protein
MSDADNNAAKTGQTAADTTGAAGASSGAQFDAAEVASLRAAAAELARIKSERAAAEQAEAVKRGEHEAVIAQLRAESEAAKATATRQAEDLALVGIHAGLADAEAREVARTLYGLVPESKRAASLAEQVKQWAKKPDEAPRALQGYFGAAPQTTGLGSSTRGAQANDKDRAATLARMKQLGFPEDDYDHFVTHVQPRLRTVQ